MYPALLYCLVYPALLHHPVYTTVHARQLEWRYSTTRVARGAVLGPLPHQERVFLGFPESGPGHPGRG